MDGYTNYEPDEEDPDEYSPRQPARMNNERYRNSMDQRSYFVSNSLQFTC